ncbi:MAG TPA: ABC transporter substrate binding protein, partial [Methylomirabilota bacterium]|nr:ABC transporter substrate binding protein [Methylomirabilota bacterium]
MDRRTFVATLAGGLLAAPVTTEAQRPVRPATIGVLASTQLTGAVQAAIRDGLKEQGYIEGQNIVIEWRSADGRRDRAAALAGELALLHVDVIVALLTPAAQAAKNATSSIPIVMAPVGDPIAS